MKAWAFLSYWGRVPGLSPKVYDYGWFCRKYTRSGSMINYDNAGSGVD